MGSVKDLEILQKPTSDAMGVGRFHFSDRYSVFDWGEMPDHIEGKGEALCVMGAYCFEQLQKIGVKTHYRGIVSSAGKVVAFSQLDNPSSAMEVSLVNVIKPETRLAKDKLEYDYGVFSPNLKNYLIPLEIIYRNGLPEGSSVFKRLEQGKTTPKALGLDHFPKPDERLATPLFDVSTKLEETDRYVAWEEAQKIAGLTPKEVADVKILLLNVDTAITEIAAGAGLENEDGKIELAFDPQRRLMVVDVVGTLDECRFTYEGFHVSKEIARQFYKKTPWYRDVEEAKRTAEARGIKDWKSLCKSQPPKLDPNLKTFISHVYKAAANELTGRRMFDVPSLAETIDKYKKLMGEET